MNYVNALANFMWRFGDAASRTTAVGAPSVEAVAVEAAITLDREATRRRSPRRAMDYGPATLCACLRGERSEPASSLSL